MYLYSMYIYELYTKSYEMCFIQRQTTQIELN
jgi:hypothetical protein